MQTDNIEGLRELNTRLDGMVKVLYVQEAVKPFLAAARVIRDEARRLAPVSRWPLQDRGNVRPAGALRKAIIAYSAKPRNLALGPAAWAQINIFKGRDRAPHAHLVEFGTKERVPKKAKFMWFPRLGGRGNVRAERVRGAPANPFFKKAISTAGPAALEAAAKKTQELLEAV